ncbi:MAG: alkaline phosphatase family protein [Acidobacteria bacterium]|nr:alkaline phosphatase family protein [Acidobacteriota bacterium]
MLVALWCLALKPHAQTRPTPPSAGPPVRLVLLIAVDQFRADYLTRFGPPTAGLKTLTTRGAVFTDAHLEHGITVTAVGHATMLSGATPAVSGIINNTWYERSTQTNVESITDDTVRIVGSAGGGGGTGASPRRMLVTTLGDQIKQASGVPLGAVTSPRVIGISLKDRSAILPVGHAADAAYFFRGGGFVTSTYYRDALPDWVQAVNARKIVDSFAGTRWEYQGAPDGARTYPSQPGAPLLDAVITSPAGNELVLAMAESALREERLGQRGVTDLLSVSFSSNDSVGHRYGPDSAEVRDVTRKTDLQLQRLLDLVDRQVGLGRTLVAFTADHGVGPLPESQAAYRLPGGRFSSSALTEAIEQALDARFGAATWIERIANPHVYLDRTVMTEHKADPAEVRRVAATAAGQVPHVARVYTREMLIDGQAPVDRLSQRVARSYHRHRAGDLHIVLEPNWIAGATGATHGSPYGYDSHIPLVIMGPGVSAGYFHGHVALNDLAPTLATLLGVEAPSGSEGRVLVEALSARTPAAAARRAAAP